MGEKRHGHQSRYLGEILSQEPGESSDWHTHDFGQLISAASGSMYAGTPNRILLLSPAMAVWIPPDTKHWQRYVSKNEMLYVDVNRAEAKKLGNECRVISMTPLLNALSVATLPEHSNNRSNQHSEALHSLLRHELVSAKDVLLSLVLPQDKRVRGLAESALNNPGMVSSVDAWLSEAPASRKTIERIFLDETGMPPLRWLQYARVLHAVSQLAAGEKVSSVAFDIGYQSASAFSYMFRQILGVSPSSFTPKKAFTKS